MLATTHWRLKAAAAKDRGPMTSNQYRAALTPLPWSRGRVNVKI